MRVTQKRILQAVDFIERNLNEDFTLDDLALFVGISRFTLQRLFRAGIGESLKSYTRKRRLTQAAQKLKHSQTRIIELALDAGFASQEAFTRAFQNYFGVTPGCYRRDPSSRKQPGLFPATRELLEHRFHGVSLTPRIEHRSSEWPICGWGVGADFEDDTPIATLWDKVIEHLTASTQPEMVVGVTQAHHPEIPLVGEQCIAYLAGIERSQWPESQEHTIQVTVPPGLYAVFEHTGPLQHIVDTVNYAWASWLPQCKYLKSSRPDLELVSLQSLHTAEPRMELWVSIEEANS